MGRHANHSRREFLKQARLQLRRRLARQPGAATGLMPRAMAQSAPRLQGAGVHLPRRRQRFLQLAGAARQRGQPAAATTPIAARAAASTAAATPMAWRSASTICCRSRRATSRSPSGCIRPSAISPPPTAATRRRTAASRRCSTRARRPSSAMPGRWCSRSPRPSTTPARPPGRSCSRTTTRNCSGTSACLHGSHPMARYGWGGRVAKRTAGGALANGCRRRSRSQAPRAS
jgi:hypothetical protein